MRVIFLHIIFLLFAADALTAQAKEQFLADMAASKSMFQKNKNCKINTSYNYYKTHESTDKSATMNSATYISGSLYYQQIGEVHTLIENNLVAIIDEDENQIVLDKNELDVLDFVYHQSLSSNINHIETITLKDQINSREYTIDLAFGEIAFLVLNYDITLNQVSSIKLFYGQSMGLEDTLQEEEFPRLEIFIDPILTIEKMPVSWENNPFFLTTDNLDASLKGKFKSYSIINNLRLE